MAVLAWVALSRRRVRGQTDELRGKNEELGRALHEAEGATRVKSEFLANMSHEIRTPMNGILRIIELAQNTSLSPEQSEFITGAQQSAESLLILLNDIPDFSKVEAGHLDLQLQPVDFSVRRCLGRAVGRARDGG